MISRREFLKKGVGSALGVCVFGTLFSKVYAAGGQKKISFEPICKGKKGCARCQKAVEAILKDEKQCKSIEDILTGTADKVYFYVRKHSSRVKPQKFSITVGSCTKRIKRKSDIYIPGCGKRMTPTYVYNTLMKELKKQFLK